MNRAETSTAYSQRIFMVLQPTGSAPHPLSQLGNVQHCQRATAYTRLQQQAHVLEALTEISQLNALVTFLIFCWNCKEHLSDQKCETPTG